VLAELAKRWDMPKAKDTYKGRFPVGSPAWVRADDIVACIDQPGNEPAADRAARSGDEHTHVSLLPLRVSSWRRTGEAGGDS